MGVSCHEVWESVSEYVDGELAPSQARGLEEHAEGCHRCRAVVEGTRNVVHLFRDERMMPLPATLSSGIRRRLAERIEPQRGSGWGWAVVLASGGALALTLLSARIPGRAIPGYLSPMSQPARRSLPAQVFLVRTGKLFHVAECPYMHGDAVSMDSAEAIREGYTPCTRCMAEFLAHPPSTADSTPSSADNFGDGGW